MTFLNPRDVHAPVGPYSHTAAVPPAMELIFISGQVGMRPDGSIPASFADQAEVTFENLRACLAAHGLGVEAVVKLGCSCCQGRTSSFCVRSASGTSVRIAQPPLPCMSRSWRARLTWSKSKRLPPRHRRIGSSSVCGKKTQMKHHPGSRFAGMHTAIVLSLAFCGSHVWAHHSTAEYDANAFAEARGEVVSVLWRNPHVRFQVSTKSLDGNDQLWEIESADLTRLDRAGLPRDILKVGDVVTFAGNPSTRRERRMYVTNLLGRRRPGDLAQRQRQGALGSRSRREHGSNSHAGHDARCRVRGQPLPRKGLGSCARRASARLAPRSAAHRCGARGQSRLRRGRR